MLDVFNAAISPTVSGNRAVIHYNISSENLKPKLKGRSRTSGDPLGQMLDPVPLGSSDTYASGARWCDQDQRPDCRWGDYAGASPDFQRDNWVWGSNMLVGPRHDNGDPHWKTRNFAIRAGP